MKKLIFFITTAVLCAFAAAQEHPMPQWMRLTIQGESLVRQGQFNEALDFFIRAEAEEPGSTRVLMNIALTRKALAERERSEEERKKQYSSYIEYLKKVLAIDPIHDDARYFMDLHLGIIHENKPFQLKESEEYYKAGRTAMQSGAFDAASEIFQKGLDGEKHPDFYKSLGVAALQSGETVKAEGYFNDSLRLQPVQYDIYMILGELSEQRGNPGQAREYYIRALASYPHYFKAMQKISIVTRKMGKPVRFLNIADPVPREKREIDPGDIIAVRALSEELKHNLFELQCWLYYHREIREKKAEFEKGNPGSEFVHTARIETAAVSGMLKYYAENRETMGVRIEQFETLIDQEKKGFLEGAVYFYRWRDEFAGEFVEYRRTHFNDFRKMFEEHL